MDGLFDGIDSVLEQEEYMYLSARNAYLFKRKLYLHKVIKNMTYIGSSLLMMVYNWFIGGYLLFNDRKNDSLLEVISCICFIGTIVFAIGYSVNLVIESLDYFIVPVVNEKLTNRKKTFKGFYLAMLNTIVHKGNSKTEVRKKNNNNLNHLV